MNKIKMYICKLNEELEDSQYYAEKYITCKAYGNTSDASKYKEMSSDELKHASFIYGFMTEYITKLKTVMTFPYAMQDEIDKAQAEYAEKVARIKMMHQI